ncbi:MAG: PA14 domain-containing protein [Turicibacter sp.]
MRSAVLGFLFVVLGYVAVAMLTGCSPQIKMADAEAPAPKNGVDGKDGANGKDGKSCTVEQLTNGFKMSCPDGSFATVYNGTNGAAGSSCTATPTTGGISVKCGTNAPVFLTNGTNGVNGTNGADGADAIQPGLLCKVYDSRSVDRSEGLFKILNNATPKFEKVINQLDIPDSPSASGFPKFTAAERALVGDEDYALDCDGFLNVPVSGSYQFKMLSDDGSKLVINNNTLINMDQLQSPTVGTSNVVTLFKGPNKINVIYFQGPHSQIALKLDWSGPTSSGLSTSTLLPAAYLRH